jgi:histidinol-phosphate aminotransferase
MKNLVNNNIIKMMSYNPPLEGRAGLGYLLLDFNERTKPYDNKITKYLKKYIDNNTLNIYPEYKNICQSIADYTRVKKNNVLVTNGSDQAIDVIFKTFTKKNDQVIIPTPSFAWFFQCAKMNDNIIVSPQYKRKDLSFPLTEVLESISPNTKMIIICNPNNPTGTMIINSDIEKILQSAKNAIVYIDEAYYEFSNSTAAPLLKKYPNLVISRTFSKAFGQASLRMGYIIANEKIVKQMLKVRGPYDVNSLSVCSAQYVLKNLAGLKSYTNEINLKSKPLIEKFFQKNKIKFYPSGANFLIFKPNNAEFVYQTLLANNIRVRPQNKTPIKNTLRLTIGTTNQMKQFIEIFETRIIRQKYAFIDRDGVLIYEPTDTYQIDSLDKLKILPGVITGLRRLIKNNYKLIMISNQDGLGTNSFPQKNFEIVQNKLIKSFKNNQIIFDKIFICPHLPTDNCVCRKPQTGLVNDFFQNNSNSIDWQNSFYCGDRESDRDFARNVRLKYLSIKTNSSFFSIIKKLKI